MIKDCPDKPNCVSSLAVDAHHIEPLTSSTDINEVWTSLQILLAATPRVELVSQNSLYLHAFFTSRVFRFVDDVEFSLDAENNVIHVRSASRTGYWDFGANRRRIEWIRKKLNLER